MYCPKCASQATEGQRFCRQCGTNLGLIVDAMDSKRGPVDFERLKQDLKELGSSLRTGFEQAHKEIKKSQWGKGRYAFDVTPFSDATQKATVAASNASAVMIAKKEELRARRLEARELRKNRGSRTAAYHFQQAILKILTGGAGAVVWYYILNTASSSGLLASIENIVRMSRPELSGFVPVIQMLWVLGLVPVARGIGHLAIGTGLLATRKNEPHPEPVTAPDALPASAAERTTSEFHPEFGETYSVTEEPTVPLQAREPRRTPN